MHQQRKIVLIDCTVFRQNTHRFRHTASDDERLQRYSGKFPLRLVDIESPPQKYPDQSRPAAVNRYVQIPRTEKKLFSSASNRASSFFISFTL